MANKKTIFIAFAIEDEKMRDLIKGQALNTESPFEYIDMSVKEPYKTAWKDRVRTRIKRSDGVLAIIARLPNLRAAKLGKSLVQRKKEYLFVVYRLTKKIEPTLLV